LSKWKNCINLKENTFPFKGTCLAREGEYDRILFDFFDKNDEYYGFNWTNYDWIRLKLDA